MSEQEHQSSDKPKHSREVQGTKRTSRKHAQQAAPASLPMQEASSGVAVPYTTGSTAPSEPAIGERWGEFPTKERQAELKKRLEVWEQEPDHGTRSSPFAGVTLTGADVYWLAALVAGEGEADVGRQMLNNFLIQPLTSLNLAGASLGRAQLKDARLYGAQLTGANLFMAQLKRADLREAELTGAGLDLAELTGASLAGAQLKGVGMGGAQLKGAVLKGAELAGAELFDAQLKGADLSEAHLDRADLRRANLEHAILYGAHLEETNLSEAHLEGADLSEAHLEGADLSEAHLEGAFLYRANLTHKVDLRKATCDVKTKFAEADIDMTLHVADVAWNGVSLILEPWEQVPRLGDEALAHQPLTRRAKRKDARQWLEGYEAAARAYRQLAITLRSQGITEAADRFTYRALIMQRKALWWQLRNRKINKLGSYLFSLFLAGLTGYGFRMWRIIVAYALLILAFAGGYWVIDRQAHNPLNIGQSLIVSITAFHGRVFSYNPFTLSDPQIVVTAIEAICGLVIEGLFVAMLVQRFFNR